MGTITRGTTNPNRLRRMDRWLVATQAWRWRSAQAPVVVDLGYGASPVTAVELRDRLRPTHPGLRVVGIEIDPERVAAAQPLAGDGLEFVRGGFEVPVPGGARPNVVRAFNVLRQYDEAGVEPAWARVRERLAPGGILIDGTCDELGRLATWIVVAEDGPVSLTLSWRLRGLGAPSEIAARLPKALIHHNVPGEAIHDLLGRLDDGWARALPGWGARQRFIATVESLVAAGWPVIGGRSRWRLGEVTIAWDAVAPR